ncbi:hypothetical protein FRB99_001015 [Tulasnella sp. 403]|nr:hypothetical protein FRB99_001015 [Tulasnella sp. 403]
MFRPKLEPEWEVVDHKQIAQVPMFLDVPDVEIVSVFPNDVSHTYTFQGPVSSPMSSAASSPKSRNRTLSSSPSSKRPPLISKFVHATSSCGRQFLLHLSHHSKSRTHSSASSSDSESDYDDVRTIHSSHHIDHSTGSDFTLAQTKAALKFARSQLLSSAEFKSLGANALFSEAWSITRLRKGTDQYRLQIRYSGRPAYAIFPSSAPQTPPFMDLLAEL